MLASATRSRQPSHSVSLPRLVLPSTNPSTGANRPRKSASSQHDASATCNAVSSVGVEDVVVSSGPCSRGGVVTSDRYARQAALRDGVAALMAAVASVNTESPRNRTATATNQSKRVGGGGHASEGGHQHLPHPPHHNPHTSRSGDETANSHPHARPELASISLAQRPIGPSAAMVAAYHAHLPSPPPPTPPGETESDVEETNNATRNSRPSSKRASAGGSSGLGAHHAPSYMTATASSQRALPGASPAHQRRESSAAGTTAPPMDMPTAVTVPTPRNRPRPPAVGTAHSARSTVGASGGVGSSPIHGRVPVTSRSAMGREVRAKLAERRGHLLELEQVNRVQMRRKFLNELDARELAREEMRQQRAVKKTTGTDHNQEEDDTNATFLTHVVQQLTPVPLVAMRSGAAITNPVTALLREGDLELDDTSDDEGRPGTGTLRRLRRDRILALPMPQRGPGDIPLFMTLQVDPSLANTHGPLQLVQRPFRRAVMAKGSASSASASPRVLPPMTDSETGDGPFTHPEGVSPGRSGSGGADAVQRRMMQYQRERTARFLAHIHRNSVAFGAEAGGSGSVNGTDWAATRQRFITWLMTIRAARVFANKAAERWHPFDDLRRGPTAFHPPVGQARIQELTRAALLISRNLLRYRLRKRIERKQEATQRVKWLLELYTAEFRWRHAIRMYVRQAIRIQRAFRAFRFRRAARIELWTRRFLVHERAILRVILLRRDPKVRVLLEGTWGDDAVAKRRLEQLQREETFLGVSSDRDQVRAVLAQLDGTYEVFFLSDPNTIRQTMVARLKSLTEQFRREYVTYVRAARAARAALGLHGRYSAGISFPARSPPKRGLYGSLGLGAVPSGDAVGHHSTGAGDGNLASGRSPSVRVGGAARRSIAAAGSHPPPNPVAINHHHRQQKQRSQRSAFDDMLPPFPALVGAYPRAELLRQIVAAQADNALLAGAAAVRAAETAAVGGATSMEGVGGGSGGARSSDSGTSAERDDADLVQKDSLLEAEVERADAVRALM